jgi:hypothetical protein
MTMNAEGKKKEPTSFEKEKEGRWATSPQRRYQCRRTLELLEHVVEQAKKKLRSPAP